MNALGRTKSVWRTRGNGRDVLPVCEGEGGDEDEDDEREARAEDVADCLEFLGRGGGVETRAERDELAGKFAAECRGVVISGAFDRGRHADGEECSGRHGGDTARDIEASHGGGVRWVDGEGAVVVGVGYAADGDSAGEHVERPEVAVREETRISDDWERY
jgi:hypothetical protein